MAFLSPKSKLAGAESGATATSKVPSPAASLCMGAMGFTVASLVVFGSWAFAGRWMYEQLGELGAYAVWAVMFVLIAGGTLNRLVVGERNPLKFYLVFAAAFLLYAVAWTVAWFTLLRSLRVAELLGSLIGTLLMSGVFVAAFSAWRRAIAVMITLFVAHSLGYFAGGFLYDTVGGRAGMLLWGLAYGLGFGAGIGRALFLCQTQSQGTRLVPRDGGSSQ